MSRKVYDDGALVEEWDDDTRTYRRYDGDVIEERPYTDDEAAFIVERETEARRLTFKAGLEEQARQAMAANREDVDRDALIRADALEIANHEATTLTSAQTVVVLKRLARGVALLAEHDARTKQQANVLIRLAVGQLDPDQT